MSYATMDHAGWVQSNLPHHKKAVRNQKPSCDSFGYAKGWHGAPDKLSNFHARVFDILGMTFGGIYNAPIEWESVRWSHPRMLVLNWRNSMSTWDFSELTTAVLLAHDAAIRLSISPKMRWLEIMMHEREPHVEGMRLSLGHPTLEQAVARHRARFPSHHHVHYRPTQEQVEASQ